MDILLYKEYSSCSYDRILRIYHTKEEPFNKDLVPNIN